MTAVVAGNKVEIVNLGWKTYRPQGGGSWVADGSRWQPPVSIGIVR